MFAGPEAADRVSAESADTLTLSVTGPRSSGLEVGGDNLVLRAAQALCVAEGRSHGAALTLDKHLPVAAGIGGGSADAGATLRVLQKLWSLERDLVRQVAVPLGGDVPVALAGRRRTSSPAKEPPSIASCSGESSGRLPDRAGFPGL